MGKRLTEYERRRLDRRDTIWPDAVDVIYDRRCEKGFSTVPRTLGMVATLLKTISGKGDPSRVYLELWLRQRDDAFVELDDLDELGSITGYHRGATRRVRSFREALDRLAALGFIRVAAKGPRKYGFILVVHPHDAVQELRHKNPKLIPDWWWDLFRLRLQDIGAVLRWEPEPAPTAEDAFGEIPEALDDDGLPF